MKRTLETVHLSDEKNEKGTNEEKGTFLALEYFLNFKYI